MEAVGTVKSGDVKPPESLTYIATEVLDKNQKTAENAPKKRTQETKAPPREVREDTRSRIENIAQAMDKYVKSIQRDLQIQVHSETGDIIVKVLSKEDGKVIREIPPEAMLKLAEKMEEMTGVLFNENV